MPRVVKKLKVYLRHDKIGSFLCGLREPCGKSNLNPASSKTLRLRRDEKSKTNPIVWPEAGVDE